MTRNPYDYYITDEEYELAASNGISRRVLSYRIRDFGWSKQKALTTPVQKRSKYPQWAMDLAVANNIQITTFQNRVRRGWDLESAATLSVEDARKKVHESNRKYPTEIVQLAADNNIPYGTFVRRVIEGWDIEQAMSTPILTKQQALSLARAKSSSRLGIEAFWNAKKGHFAE